MEIRRRIITIVDKITSEGLEEIKIPKGTMGTIWEINGSCVLVEIRGDSVPKGVEGVYDFELSEIKEFVGFKTFSKPN